MGANGCELVWLCVDVGVGYCGPVAGSMGVWDWVGVRGCGEAAYQNKT